MKLIISQVGQKIYRITLCLLLISHFSFLISCKTISHSPDFFFDDGIIPLDNGASIYIFANVRQARPIIDMLDIKELENKQIKQMIDRTSNAMIALFPPESGRRFQIAAWGNYPSSGARTAFTFNNNWKKYSLDKQRLEKISYANRNNYWHSGGDRLSLSLTARDVCVAAWLNDTPADPFATGVEMPEGFNHFSNGASLSCWINNPAPVFQRILSEIGAPIRVPVEQLLIKMNSVSDSNYEATVRLTFGTPAYARTVAAILGFAGNISSSDPKLKMVMLFLANPPVQNGRNVDIKTALISKSEILPIINTFSNL